MLFTIFTPTYNRAYIIHKLYQSLCEQTFRDFEWVVVDDGSTDHTEELIQSFIQENKIVIRYFKQQNAGKHIAINRGVQEAEGELFFIVDSDDRLYPHTLDRLKFYYDQVASDPNFAGISGRRAYPSGSIIGGDLRSTYIDCTNLEIGNKYKQHGDSAEAYRTEILRRYPFPFIEGERFCSESLVWQRIAQKYKLRYYNESIYECDYLEDGLTANNVRLRMNNPQASMLVNAELAHCNVPCMVKLKASVNYWRFSFNSIQSFSQKIKSIGLLKSIIALPLGWLMYLNDKRKC